MELAIGTALLVGALCMLLMVIMQLTAVLNRKTTQRTNERMTVDRVGEEFYHACKYSHAFDAERYSLGAYEVVEQQPAEDVRRLLVYSRNEVAPALLWLEVQGSGEAVVILRWSYRYGPIHVPVEVEAEEPETPEEPEGD